MNFMKVILKFNQSITLIRNKVVYIYIYIYIYINMQNSEKVQL